MYVALLLYSDPSYAQTGVKEDRDDVYPVTLCLKMSVAHLLRTRTGCMV